MISLVRQVGKDCFARTVDDDTGRTGHCSLRLHFLRGICLLQVRSNRLRVPKKSVSSQFSRLLAIHAPTEGPRAEAIPEPVFYVEMHESPGGKLNEMFRRQVLVDDDGRWCLFPRQHQAGD